MASAVPAGRAGPGWPLPRSVEHLAGPGRSLGGRRPAPLPPQPPPGAGGDSMKPLWALGRRANHAVCLGCLPHLLPSEGPCSRTTRPPLWRRQEPAEIREAPERDPTAGRNLLRFPTLPCLLCRPREIGRLSQRCPERQSVTQAQGLEGSCTVLRNFGIQRGLLEVISTSVGNPPQLSHLHKGTNTSTWSLRRK